MKVMIGVDPHKGSHTATMLDRHERKVRRTWRHRFAPLFRHHDRHRPGAEPQLTSSRRNGRSPGSDGRTERRRASDPDATRRTTEPAIGTCVRPEARVGSLIERRCVGTHSRGLLQSRQRPGTRAAARQPLAANQNSRSMDRSRMTGSMGVRFGRALVRPASWIIWRPSVVSLSRSQERAAVSTSTASWKSFGERSWPFAQRCQQSSAVRRRRASGSSCANASRWRDVSSRSRSRAASVRSARACW